MDVAIFEQRRMAALSARRPLEYFEYCVASGIDSSENPGLFHEGAILFDLKRGDSSANVAGLPVEARYVLLKQRAKKLSDRLDKDSEKKKNLLVALFPGRFGLRGQQNLFGYSPAEIGSLFRGLLETARDAEYDFNR